MNPNPGPGSFLLRRREIVKKRTVPVILGALFVSVQLLAQAAASTEPTLYKRLGGYDAVAAVTDDMIGRLLVNKQLTRFFVGLSDDSKAKLRQNFVNQICAATGGPCLYTGRDMKTSHKGMGITGADWDAAVKDLTDTLEKFKVPAKEKGELLAIVSNLKADIVEKP
jgi:hemoglobin